MTSMVTAAPAMTSMYAQAPATYAQAPTMTSMYATPGASMYMPQTTMAAPYAYAAPTMVETMAAPQTMMMTQAPSYVAAPQMMVAAPQYVEVAAPAGIAFNMPAPMKLTQGLVTPDLLNAEKVAYNKALEGQLKKQSDAAFAEAEIKKKMVQQQATTQLAEFQLQVEEQVKMTCLRIDQEAQMQAAGLQEAAITQQTARNEQTAIQAADYTKKKCLEEFSVKSYEVNKQWWEKEQAMMAQYNQVRQAGSNAVMTPGMVM